MKTSTVLNLLTTCSFTVSFRIFLCIIFLIIAFPASSQKKLDLLKGHYYDKKGDRRNGFLAYKPNRRRIVLYLENENAQPEKINAKRLKAFVIDKDSFAIISDFFVEGVYQDRIWARKPDIAKVLEVGNVSLYLCHFIEMLEETPQPNPSRWNFEWSDEITIPVYILRRHGSPLLQSVPESQASFNKVMAKYFEDDPELAEEITNGKYANRTVPELVRRFNNKTK